MEAKGGAGTYLREHVRVGDALEVSSPRGSFILESGERPVVLLSAGIGATPVLAMLNALAAARATRQVLWLHAARDREHHPFVSAVRRLMHALPHGRTSRCSRWAASRPWERGRLTGAFWHWREPAPPRSVGRGAPVCVMAGRAVWSGERSSPDQGRSTTPPTATFSFAARSRFAMSSSICEV